MYTVICSLLAAVLEVKTIYARWDVVFEIHTTFAASPMLPQLVGITTQYRLIIIAPATAMIPYYKLDISLHSIPHLFYLLRKYRYPWSCR